ncbi:hypothetical protein DID78_01980 [Candidatus Marinamargulisbacteria bacterium SCGC AG-343-D04]|nr:hypothetical protein DID78_01980 [Candidatus Marinamargulisbacteria bacterium SCGC AG-343-D04]
MSSTPGSSFGFRTTGPFQSTLRRVPSNMALAQSLRALRPQTAPCLRSTNLTEQDSTPRPRSAPTLRKHQRRHRTVRLNRTQENELKALERLTSEEPSLPKFVNPKTEIVFRQEQAYFKTALEPVKTTIIADMNIKVDTLKPFLSKEKFAPLKKLVDSLQEQMIPSRFEKAFVELTKKLDHTTNKLSVTLSNTASCLLKTNSSILLSPDDFSRLQHIKEVSTPITPDTLSKKYADLDKIKDRVSSLQKTKINQFRTFVFNNFRAHHNSWFLLVPKNSPLNKPESFSPELSSQLNEKLLAQTKSLLESDLKKYIPKESLATLETLKETLSKTTDIRTFLHCLHTFETIKHLSSKIDTLIFDINELIVDDSPYTTILSMHCPQQDELEKLRDNLQERPTQQNYKTSLLAYKEIRAKAIEASKKALKMEDQQLRLRQRNKELEPLMGLLETCGLKIAPKDLPKLFHGLGHAHYPGNTVKLARLVVDTQKPSRSCLLEAATIIPIPDYEYNVANHLVY